MFPDTYPTTLKAVSYIFEENIGILNNWNKHCKTCKENHYFVIQCLKQWVWKTYFSDSQMIPIQVWNMIKYICECISVKWTEDEFVVKFKKEKDGDKFKVKFKEEEYYKLAEKALISKKDSLKFLKAILEYLKKFYNNEVIIYNKNKFKKL